MRNLYKNIRNLDKKLGDNIMGYRNEIGVILWNASGEDQIINPGDRIAQLVLAKVEQAELIEKDEIDTNTDRGLGGYGHTGKQ